MEFQKIVYFRCYVASLLQFVIGLKGCRCLILLNTHIFVNFSLRIFSFI